MDKFYMIYAKGHGGTAKQFPQFKDVVFEAERLAEKTGKPVYVLECIKEILPEPKPKYKVGDWVKVLKVIKPSLYKYIGNVYKIKDITTLGNYTLENVMDEQTEDTYHWCFEPDWLEPAEEPKHEYKVGDWVKFEGKYTQINSIYNGDYYLDYNIDNCDGEYFCIVKASQFEPYDGELKDGFPLVEGMRYRVEVISHNSWYGAFLGQVFKVIYRFDKYNGKILMIDSLNSYVHIELPDCKIIEMVQK